MPVPMLVYAAIATIVFLNVYINVRKYLDTTQRAWVFTGLASLVVSVLSALSMFVYGWEGWEPITLEVISREDVFGRVIAEVFLVYLILDLAVGMFDYREHITWLFGFGHHTAYICLMVYALRNGYTHMCGMVMIEELPTCVLAAGRMFPRLKSKLLFVGLFFVLRLVMQTWFHYLAYLGGMDVWPWLFFSSCAIVLHIVWFVLAVRNLCNDQTYYRVAGWRTERGASKGE